ncbi:acyl-CoA N-acyltransferase [Hypoxylon rubiginosum]|uniref:Acyl-CoA N-acyltransferase n=1 Tax=Hypoxylon rubiginosum TaxID=110542 RepID=A0ACC0D3Z1_9PEZI|nr:acyl-CoA N-acyltransferase [Hypoxylon rubiginosum]
MATIVSESTTESTPAPIVTTDKCLIRAYALSDAQALADAGNHPEIVAYMRDTFPNPYTLESANFWIDFALKMDPMVNFVICTLDGTPAGGIGLKPQNDVDSRNWELGYWVAMDHWGKGVATSAAKAFSLWAFKQFPDLLRIEAGVFSDNTGSMKVLERIGFTKEGVKRRAIYKKGKIMDLAIYGLLREEAERLG